MKPTGTAPGERREISLYVHVPFCRSRCVYCATAGAEGSPERYGAFLEALAVEWDLIREEEGFADDSETRIASIYVGGGTPSLLGSRHLLGLLTILRTGSIWQTDCEVSVQINPEDVTRDFAGALLDGGYGRFSVGVQSFDDADLEHLGRKHSAEQAQRGVEEVRRAGCRDLNIDLMFGIPRQSLESWEASLRRGISFEPEHLGCNPLTRAEDTQLDRLLRGDFQPTPVEEATLQQYQGAQRLLAEAGLEFYQIHNCARAGRRCRHHERTWDRQACYGLGAGAHSFDGRHRWRNEADVDAYLNSLLEQRQRPPRDAYRLGSDDQAREVLWLGVRQAAGVAWERLAELISPGVLAAVQRKARFLAAQGYLDVGREGTRLRPEAYYVADNVCLELLRAMAGGSA